MMTAPLYPHLIMLSHSNDVISLTSAQVSDEFPLAKIYFAVPATHNPYRLYESAFRRDFFVIDLVENSSAFV